MKKYLKLILLFGLLLFASNTNAQELVEPLSDKQTDKLKKGFSSKQFFKGLYKDFLKYGTVYGAGDISNSVEARQQTFFVRTAEDGSLYSIPEVVDNTPDYPFDYRYGFGIRKLARFDYERKPKNFYDGTENQLAFSAPTSAFKGLEYQIHFEKERWRDELYKNHRVFIKHTGKNHIFKSESREVGKINLKYQSAEVRGRLPIGEKFSLSGGVIYRTHQRPYGYNPVEIWLNETNEEGNAINPWYTLGFMYGYSDHYATIQVDGVNVNDWYWEDEEGNVIAHTDLEFRETVFTDLMNRYNEERWDELDGFGEIAPIVGFDFYHYKNKFWLHAYANYIIPYHEYVKGDVDFSYLHRDCWGVGGHIEGCDKSSQWDDYSAGINFGWKIGKHLGVFVEGEYAKMWESELYNTTIGLNYTFK
tara:strand:- start:27422 stop:28675 length:1254 start_codon:yes stop_codon:yes gene_type:complete